MSRWRVGWKWYLIGPGIITGYLVIALLIVLALGVEVTNTDVLSWTVIAGLVAELVLFGGQWEEPGWSGYALPALQPGWLPGGSGCSRPASSSQG